MALKRNDSSPRKQNNKNFILAAFSNAIIKNKTGLARIAWAALFCFLKALINFIIS